MPQLRLDGNYKTDIVALRGLFDKPTKRMVGKFVVIDVMSTTTGTTIQAHVQQSDLYVYAFQNAVCTFYFNDYPGNVPSAKNTRKCPSLKCDYNALGAFPSGGLEISGSTLDSAVKYLAGLEKKGEEITGSYVALLAFAVSEAIRFESVANLIQGELDYSSFGLKSTDIKDTVQNWKKAATTDANVIVRAL
jgi:hypothetical protein